MRYLSVSVVAAAFAFASGAVLADCPGHGVAQTPATTVATADGAAPQSTRIQTPAPQTGG